MDTITERLTNSLLRSDISSADSIISENIDHVPLHEPDTIISQLPPQDVTISECHLGPTLHKSKPLQSPPANGSSTSQGSSINPNSPAGDEISVKQQNTLYHLYNPVHRLSTLCAKHGFAPPCFNADFSSVSLYDGHEITVKFWRNKRITKRISSLAALEYLHAKLGLGPVPDPTCAWVNENLSSSTTYSMNDQLTETAMSNQSERIPRSINENRSYAQQNPIKTGFETVSDISVQPLFPQTMEVTTQWIEKWLEQDHTVLKQRHLFAPFRWHSYPTADQNYLFEVICSIKKDNFLVYLETPPLRAYVTAKLARYLISQVYINVF